MIVDTSAILAILLNEPEARDFAGALVDAPHCKVSAGSWIEVSALIVRRNHDLQAMLDQLAEKAKLTIEPVTAEQAQIGSNACREFGLGSRHRARLNFGDCFAYALAKATGEPLLCKGEEFAQTDVRTA